MSMSVYVEAQYVAGLKKLLEVESTELGTKQNCTELHIQIQVQVESQISAGISLSPKRIEIC